MRSSSTAERPSLPSLSREDALRLRLTSLLLVRRRSVAPGRNAHSTASTARTATATAGATAQGHAVKIAAIDVAGVVEWFGAMQAQDLGSVMWSLGVRLPEHARADVETALEQRAALRTWPMRGTVHLIPPGDARWMLDLMGGRALSSARARRAALGLTDAEVEKAVSVLEAALSGGRRLTRAACLQTLADAGIRASGNFGYHLLWYASQLGVTCIAPNVGREQTFALLDDWAPEQARPDRDEALATMAIRYFRSHGPTTRQDFSGWTGLLAADAKAGIAAAGDCLARVDVEGVEMLMDAAVLDAGPQEPPDLLALPGFDEYLLGYKDRSFMVAQEHMQQIVPGGNGVFQATIIRHGRVIATWKKSSTPARTTVTVAALVALTSAERLAVADCFDAYARYLDAPVQVRWS